MLFPWLCTVATLNAAWSLPVRAQDSQEAPQAVEQSARVTATEIPSERALEHYERGRLHYLGGRYRNALTELEIAVNLDPNSPDLVYNVARVYELLGEIDHAIAFYRRYLEMLPKGETEERARTLSTLQRLDGARHVVDSAPKAQPTMRVRGVADGAFWTLAGLGALSLVGAGTTGALAWVNQKESNDFRLGVDGSAKRRQSLVDRTHRLAVSSDAMLLMGVVLGVTAVLLYSVRERTVAAPPEPTRPYRIDVRASPAGAFLTLEANL